MVLRSLSKGCAACPEVALCPKKRIEACGCLDPMTLLPSAGFVNQETLIKGKHDDAYEVHLSSDFVVNINKDAMLREFKKRFDIISCKNI